MSEPATVPTTAERLKTAERSYRSLQEETLLTDLSDRAEDLQSQVSAALHAVRTIRQRGYVFEPDLEERSIELQEQWAQLRPQVFAEIETQRERLAKSMKAIDIQIRGARSSGAAQGKSLDRLETGLEDMSARVNAAESAVRGLYDSFASQLSQHRAHLGQLDRMMTEAAESTFHWLPSEGLLRAVDANWIRNQGDEPRGILFLTDQRLLFERKEQVATKKILFVTTEKKNIQEPLFEAPVASIEQARSEHQGLMGHEDHLFLDMDSSAPLSAVHFHIDGQDSDSWVAAIRRAIAREFDLLRVEPISEEEEARLRRAPTECGSCGAAIGGPLLRGQRQITCAYCGSVMRV